MVSNEMERTIEKIIDDFLAEIQHSVDVRTLIESTSKTVEATTVFSNSKFYGGFMW